MSIEEINKMYPVLLVQMIEDDPYYIETAQRVLAANGLPHTKPFLTPESYETWLKENPKATVHIVIVDYKFNSGLTGVDIAMMLYERCRRKRVKTKVLMITGFDDPREMAQFIRYRGHAWIFKHRTDFESAYKEALQTAIEEIKQTYEDIAFLQDIKSQVVNLAKEDKLSQNPIEEDDTL